ncbi:zinc metalloprotease [Actinokineospora cianjurensis]|uniref:Pregnancy-associated plasma protein-A n=1 Tax=Actinokineospora cianjurensis TaxID=585224 RepID=A0A421B2P6_9PSEU|nr:zinc metalloprotease [Actinokineospora cianjurensis]RLK58560.1 pregnancy-associated plasma protein-A [Actinokineospora cianjurensis]
MRPLWSHRLRRIGLVTACTAVLPGVLTPVSAASTVEGCITRAAYPVERPARDDGPPSAAEAAANERDFHTRLAARGAIATLAPEATKVYVHVIAKDETPEGGNVPDSVIDKQLEVLNADFGSTGFSFAVQEITRTVNEAWSSDASGTNRQELTRDLRTGGAADLNLYIVGGIAGGNLGWSTMPAEYKADRSGDGVGVLFSALPGGSTGPFGEGRSATHGVGGWMGLYNTFLNGCTSPGDYVDDTPYEASPAFGCPNDRDTCPQPGLDPIHNFMDYSDDACMTEFTRGQIDRMRQQMATYRDFA